MSKKLFVVLEQGFKRNTPLSNEHNKQFSTDYSDWFRLNWKADENDKNAHFFQKNIVWSEGRSLLFDKIKGKYKYYIFIDDDVKFNSKTNNSVAQELKYFFEEYKPLTGTIYGDNWAWQLYKPNKEVFPIVGHDLCCHYFQEDFANLMFPVYFHGSECSMWYAQYISNKLFPEKCMVFSKIIITNTDHLPHQDHKNLSFNNGRSVVLKFSELIIDPVNKKEFIEWNTNPKYVRQKNKDIYNNTISKSQITFTKDHLKSIINKID